VDTHAYTEAYETALECLMDIMRDENTYAAEDRIDAAATVLINEPRSPKEKETSK
jgi:hypothetical protein